MSCFDIPPRLHKGTRQKDNIVPDEEILLMRTPPRPSEIPPDLHKKDWIKFRPDKMSTFRRSLCETPSDALYNDRTGEHYNQCGIIAANVRELRAYEYAWQNPHTKKPTEDTKERYRFEVEHSPNECLFPHADICYLKNGEPKKEVTAQDVLLDMKHHVERAFSIELKEPGEI